MYYTFAFQNNTLPLLSSKLMLFLYSLFILYLCCFCILYSSLCTLYCTVVYQFIISTCTLTSPTGCFNPAHLITLQYFYTYMQWCMVYYYLYTNATLVHALLLFIYLHHFGACRLIIYILTPLWRMPS